MDPDRPILRRLLCVYLVGMFILPGSLVLMGMTEAASNPPPYGEGDWIVTENTIITDQVIRMKGNVTVRSGASLTLRNTTILMYMTHWYDYRITARTGSSLYIMEDSLIGAFDQRFAMYAEPGSTFRVQNSTLTNFTAIAVGTSDFIIEDSTIENVYHGIVIWGGSALVRRTTIIDNNDGMWNVYGDLKVRDSKFIGDHNAILEYPYCAPISKMVELGWWAPLWSTGVGDRCGGPRTMTVTNSLLSGSTSSAASLWESTATLKSNRIENSNIFGVHVLDATVFLEDNDFIGAKYGVSAELTFIRGEQTYVHLINNNFSNCWDTAVYIQNESWAHSDWQVNGETKVDSPLRLRGSVTIKDGGTMHLSNTSFGFFPFDSEPLGVTVESGGEMDLDQVSLLSLWDTSKRLFFKAEADSIVNIKNSTIDDVGFTYGSAGEMGGLYSEGELNVESSSVGESLYGIITNDGNTVVNNVSIHDTSYGLHVNGGQLDAINTEITNSNIEDLDVYGGNMVTYNTSFNGSKVAVQGGTLDVYWDCDLLTMWQNGYPIGNVSFEISDRNDVLVVSGATDNNGLSPHFWLREFTQTQVARTATTPHTIIGSVMGLTNSTQVGVHKNTRLELLVEDSINPTINVTSPALSVHQSNRTLFVEGISNDNESGIDMVQWSLDQDLWNVAEGDLEWNFTVLFEYGSHSLYVRAVDKAGNTAVVQIRVSIDKDAPYLVLMEPKDGLITGLRTVLVEGFAETGSTVSVKGRSLLVGDGTFRFSVPIDEGQNILNVTCTDLSGNSNMTSVRVIRDTIPPSIDITNPPKDYVTNDPKDNFLMVTGSTEPDADLSVNGKHIPLGGNATFSFTVPLNEGLNVINFLVRDQVGNQNSTIRKVIYDLSDPHISVVHPLDEMTYTNKTTVKISGYTEPLTEVVVTNGHYNNSGKSNGEGVFEVEIGLNENENMLSITALDIAGNSKEVTRTVYRDTVVPRIILLSVIDGMVVDDQRFLVEGETEEGAKVKINGELVEVGFSGRFSKWMDLPSANNSITVEATDRAGNSNSTTTSIKRKTTDQPDRSGVSAQEDYYPWVIMVVIIIIVVQWGIVYKRTKDRSRSDKELDRSDEARSRAHDDNDPEDDWPVENERMYPKRGTHGPKGDRIQGSFDNEQEYVEDFEDHDQIGNLEDDGPYGPEQLGGGGRT